MNDGESSPLLGSADEITASHSIWVRLISDSFAALHATLTSNWTNIFLLFVPLGILANALEWPEWAIFATNFAAILGLASVLSYTTEELSAKVGTTLGGLINAWFGNAVELLVS
jgi:Ca2+:H+ antiporter